jgi:pyrimidine operon attenuation protein/uracil phosphoribosyltransferase
MGCSERVEGEMTVVMGAEAMDVALRRMAREIVAAHPDIESLALLGILRRGRPLADRLAAFSR